MSTSTASTSQSAGTRRPGVRGVVGALGVGAGLLGALHAVVLVAYPPVVAQQSYSYPLGSGGFVASQGVLTVRDLALAALLAGLLATPVARSRVARAGIMVGAISMLLLPDQRSCRSWSATRSTSGAGTA